MQTKDSRLAGGRRLLVKLSALLAGISLLAMLVVQACSGGSPGVISTGNPPTITPGGECANPAQGCPCGTNGETAACGATVSTQGGQTTCMEGTLTCTNGQWGACQPQYTSFLPAPITLHDKQFGHHPRGVPAEDSAIPTSVSSGDAADCDPCDPYCQAFNTNSSNVDGGPGLLPTDGGGWTLAEAAPPPDGSNCIGNQCYVVNCDSGATELVGQVLDPAGNYPIANALVLIPNGGIIPPMGTGLAYNPCLAVNLPPGLGYAVTDTNGNFTIGNNPLDAAAGGGSVPVEAIPLGDDGGPGQPPGLSVPILVQVGRWRKVALVTVNACVVNDAGPITLPSVQGGPYNQDNIPHIGLITSSCDPFECLLNDMGVAQSQFSTFGGGGRIELLASPNVGDGGGPNTGGNYPAAILQLPDGGFQDPTVNGYGQLLSSPAVTSNYDMIMLPCRCAEEYEGPNNGDYSQATTSQDYNDLYGYRETVVTYANAGGRVFTSHWGREWIERVALGFDAGSAGACSPPDAAAPCSANDDASACNSQFDCTWNGLCSGGSSCTNAANQDQTDCNGAGGCAWNGGCASTGACTLSDTSQVNCAAPGGCSYTVGGASANGCDSTGACQAINGTPTASSSTCASVTGGGCTWAGGCNAPNCNNSNPGIDGTSCSSGTGVGCSFTGSCTPTTCPAGSTPGLTQAGCQTAAGPPSVGGNPVCSWTGACGLAGGVSCPTTGGNVSPNDCLGTNGQCTFTGTCSAATCDTTNTDNSTASCSNGTGNPTACVFAGGCQEISCPNPPASQAACGTGCSLGPSPTTTCEQAPSNACPSTATSTTQAACWAADQQCGFTGSCSVPTCSALTSATSNATCSTGISDYLPNGGFETGDFTAWTLANSGTTFSDTIMSGSANCHSGNYCALLGSATGTNGISGISQTFTAPVNGSGISFWYKTTCPSGSSTSKGYATVVLVDNTVAHTYSPAPLPLICTVAGVWTQITFPLVSPTMTAGHSYTVTLENDDQSKDDRTLYDDVEITSSECGFNPGCYPNFTCPVGAVNSNASCSNADCTLTVASSGTNPDQKTCFVPANTCPTTSTSTTEAACLAADQQCAFNGACNPVPGCNTLNTDNTTLSCSAGTANTTDGCTFTGTCTQIACPLNAGLTGCATGDPAFCVNTPAACGQTVACPSVIGGVATGGGSLGTTVGSCLSTDQQCQFTGTCGAYTNANCDTRNTDTTGTATCSNGLLNQGCTYVGSCGDTFCPAGTTVDGGPTSAASCSNGTTGCTLAPGACTQAVTCPALGVGSPVGTLNTTNAACLAADQQCTFSGSCSEPTCATNWDAGTTAACSTGAGFNGPANSCGFTSLCANAVCASPPSTNSCATGCNIGPSLSTLCVQAAGNACPTSLTTTTQGQCLAADQQCSYGATCSVPSCSATATNNTNALCSASSGNANGCTYNGSCAVTSCPSPPSTNSCPAGCNLGVSTGSAPNYCIQANQCPSLANSGSTTVTPNSCDIADKQCNFTGTCTAPACNTSTLTETASQCTSTTGCSYTGTCTQTAACGTNPSVTSTTCSTNLQCGFSGGTAGTNGCGPISTQTQCTNALNGTTGVGGESGCQAQPSCTWSAGSAGGNGCEATAAAICTSNANQASKAVCQGTPSNGCVWGTTTYPVGGCVDACHGLSGAVCSVTPGCSYQENNCIPANGLSCGLTFATCVTGPTCTWYGCTAPSCPTALTTTPAQCAATTGCSMSTASCLAPSCPSDLNESLTSCESNTGCTWTGTCNVAGGCAASSSESNCPTASGCTWDAGANGTANGCGGPSQATCTSELTGTGETGCKTTITGSAAPNGTCRWDAGTNGGNGCDTTNACAGDDNSQTNCNNQAAATGNTAGSTNNCQWVATCSNVVGSPSCPANTPEATCTLANGCSFDAGTATGTLANGCAPVATANSAAKCATAFGSGAAQNESGCTTAGCAFATTNGSTNGCLQNNGCAAAGAQLSASACNSVAPATGNADAGQPGCTWQATCTNPNSGATCTGLTQYQCGAKAGCAWSTPTTNGCAPIQAGCAGISTAAISAGTMTANLCTTSLCNFAGTGNGCSQSGTACSTAVTTATCTGASAPAPASGNTASGQPNCNWQGICVNNTNCTSGTSESACGGLGVGCKFDAGAGAANGCEAVSNAAACNAAFGAQGNSGSANSCDAINGCVFPVGSNGCVSTGACAGQPQGNCSATAPAGNGDSANNCSWNVATCVNPNACTAGSSQSACGTGCNFTVAPDAGANGCLATPSTVCNAAFTGTGENAAGCVAGNGTQGCVFSTDAGTVNGCTQNNGPCEAQQDAAACAATPPAPSNANNSQPNCTWQATCAQNGNCPSTSSKTACTAATCNWDAGIGGANGCFPFADAGGLAAAFAAGGNSEQGCLAAAGYFDAGAVPGNGCNTTGACGAAAAQADASVCTGASAPAPAAGNTSGGPNCTWQATCTPTVTTCSSSWSESTCLGSGCAWDAGAANPNGCEPASDAAACAAAFDNASTGGSAGCLAANCVFDAGTNAGNGCAQQNGCITSTAEQSSGNCTAVPNATGNTQFTGVNCGWGTPVCVNNSAATCTLADVKESSCPTTGGAPACVWSGGTWGGNGCGGPSSGVCSGDSSQSACNTSGGCQWTGSCSQTTACPTTASTDSASCTGADPQCKFTGACSQTTACPNGGSTNITSCTTADPQCKWTGACSNACQTETTAGACVTPGCTWSGGCNTECTGIDPSSCTFVSGCTWSGATGPGPSGVPFGWVPFPNVAAWDIDGNNPPCGSGGCPSLGYPDTLTARGAQFSQWLSATPGAAGNIPWTVADPKYDISMLLGNSVRFAYSSSQGTDAAAPPSAGGPNSVIDFTFDTPLDAGIEDGGTVNAGRVMYTDMHLSEESQLQPPPLADINGHYYPIFNTSAGPHECNPPSSGLTMQERVAEYLLFDLGACTGSGLGIAQPIGASAYFDSETYILDLCMAPTNGGSTASGCPNSCSAANSAVVWRDFDWSAIVPTEVDGGAWAPDAGLGPSIVFAFQSAPTEAALGLGDGGPGTSPIYTLPQDTVSGSFFHDVSTSLGPTGSQTWLRIYMTLNPDSMHQLPPTLTSYRQQFDCISSQ